MTDDKHSILFEILQMLNDHESRFLELGRALRKLRADEPAVFLEVAKEPALGRRRAYYMLEVDRVFGPMTHLHDRLTKIGWSKLALIARHVGPDNLETLLQQAEISGAHELRAFLKSGNDGLGARVLVLSLAGPQFDEVLQTLLKHGAYMTPKGIHNKEAALLKALAKTPA